MAFTCRPVHYNEMDSAFELVDGQDWILTRDKYKLFCKKNPGNFYVAVAETGEVAACMSLTATSTEEDLVLGNLVVSEKFRGQGLGRQFVTEILDTLQHKSVQLTAVEGVDKFYMKVGFSPCKPNHIVKRLTINHEALESRAKSHKDSVIIKPVADLPFTVDNLLTYDRRVRGYEISDFLDVITECETLLVATDLNSKSILGYACAYMLRDKLIMDGLLADSENVAVLLLQSMLSLFSSVSLVKMQMFPSNQFLAQFGQVTYTEEYTRFYLGRQPVSRAIQKKIYCVTDSDYTV